MITFDAPYVLYAAPAIAGLIALLAFWARAARVRRASAWSDDVRRIAASSGRWSALLLGVTALLAAAALAGPRFGRRVVTTEIKALTLVIAVDVSRSMLAEDAAPSRLGKVKREARRLIQDLRGDRIGLIAFAGRSFILSPLTVDDGALQLLLDGLDPDISSAGGTELALALRQGRELLLAGPGVADRVLVLFTDGEAHDSLEEVMAEARQLRREGIHLIVVGEGGSEPARIPLRDAAGELTGFQEDLDGNVVRTWRRDDVLSGISDAAQGVLVSSWFGDQAGAIRNQVDTFKRSPQATTTAAQDISRGWIPMTAAVLLLLAHTFTRRTAALAAIAFWLLAPGTAAAQGPGNPADRAWSDSAFTAAADLYEGQALKEQGGDTTWLNFGTVALALGDSARAGPALERAARSLDPELRFRALFNLGLLSLQLAERDSLNREAYLTEARRRYREALLLRPGDTDAKWNFEIATASASPDGGDSPQPPTPPNAPQDPSMDQEMPGLTRDQAEQILNSMLEEERRTQEALNRRRREPRNARRRKDW